jgi:PST family polysaccharide transporter
VAEGQALATRAVRGFLWTVSASLVQVFVITLIYHSLPTAIVGAFEWALLLIVLVALVAELGLSEALVQNRQADEEAFDAAFWVSLAVGVGLAALVYAGAEPASAWLGGDQPREFVRATRILCLMLPCAAVSGVFRARLQRDLNFAAVALSEVVSVAAFALSTVALLSRLGILAVIVGSVAREAALLASLWRSAWWVPRWRCSFRALRQILGFGLHLTGSRIVGYLSTYLASFFIYPLLGSVPTGYYRLSERLTLQPLTRLATTIFRVSLPTFATLQNDDALLRRGYLASVQSLTLALGPLLAGLYILAPELLELVGNRPAVTVLRLLAVATLLKVVAPWSARCSWPRGRRTGSSTGRCSVWPFCFRPCTWPFPSGSRGSPRWWPARPCSSWSCPSSSPTDSSRCRSTSTCAPCSGPCWSWRP